MTLLHPRRYLPTLLLVGLLCLTLSSTPHGARGNSPGTPLAGDVSPRNDFPVVFVHGFGGFGPGELLGLNMWGGLHSVPDMLRAHGFTVYELKVGPFSSNWDRACEAFYQLTGGTVDYGAAHASTHGHARYGRTFPGLYPEWGQVDAQGVRKKIHLIGHSQGGQTIRVLAKLLEDSRPEEGSGTLFQAHPDWVCSVTSISTPHDGCTLKNILADDLLPGLATPLLGAIGGMLGTLEPNPLYDPMLDQWGLSRNSGEGIVDFLGRARASGLLDDSPDFGPYDLGPAGAAELNQWCTAVPETYYFSYASSGTRESHLTDHHVPKSTMTPVFYPMAILMGAYDWDDPPVDINASWYENDGVVNTISMDGPDVGSSDLILAYSGGVPVQGAWNYMGKLDADHLQVCGWFASWAATRNLYLNHALLLRDLPAGDPVDQGGTGTGTGTGSTTTPPDPEPPAPGPTPEVIFPRGTVLLSDLAAMNNETAAMVSGEGIDQFENETVAAASVANSTTLVDGDADGLPDVWEAANGLNGTNPGDAHRDADADGLSNWLEFVYRTSATRADTDGDGIDDRWEIEQVLNPCLDDASLDYDNDTLTNLAEAQALTDPYRADTDGDQYTDGEEVAAGTDPTYPTSHPTYQPGGTPTPPASPTAPDTTWVWILVGVAGAVFGGAALYWHRASLRGRAVAARGTARATGRRVKRGFVRAREALGRAKAKVQREVKLWRFRRELEREKDQKRRET